MLSSEAAAATESHSAVVSTSTLVSAIAGAATEALTPSSSITTSASATTYDIRVDPNNMLSEHIPITFHDSVSHTNTHSLVQPTWDPSAHAAWSSFFGTRVHSAVSGKGLSTSAAVASTSTISSVESSVRGQWTTSFASTLPNGSVTSITRTVKPSTDIDATPSQSETPHHGGAGEVEASALALVGALAVALML